MNDFKIYCLFASLNLTIFASAQKSDSSFLKISYDFFFKQDSTKADKRDDILILEIGKNATYCYSYYTFLRDSLLKSQFGQQQKTESQKILINSGISRRGISVKFYKDINTDKIRLVDLVGLDWHLVEDSLADLNWQIETDTIKILNFFCHKATAKFRGRVWNAWFTDEISVAAGPMKFGKLPGLILKIEEEKDNFNFICRSVEFLNPKHLIELPKLSYIKVDNTKYKKNKKLFFENPEAFMSTSTMEIKTSNSSQTTSRPRTLIFNPMELE